MGPPGLAGPVGPPGKTLEPSTTSEIGALAFGLVVGYITYRTLIRSTENAAISDLASVISAIGGGAVAKLYDTGGNTLAFYAFGLAAGMAVYLVLFTILNGKDTAAKLMGAERIRRGNNNAGEGGDKKQPGARTVRTRIFGPRS